MFLFSLTARQCLALAVVLILLCVLYGAVYRLYLSPIARFPGPRLAALTFWYEFYYDVIKRGRYTWQLEKLHEQYGPVVRINPYELHINDPEYYDEVYAGPTKVTDKWHWSAKMFGDGGSGFSTVPHDLHRRRRAALAPFFSMRSIDQFEPVIQSAVDHLCFRLADFQKSGEHLHLGYAWSALTADIITEYSFGKSYNLLGTPDFANSFYEMLMAPSELTHMMKQFGWLFPLLEMMPHWFVALTNPPIMQLIKLQQGMEEQVRGIQARMSPDYDSVHHPTIFHELLKSDLPLEEKSMRRMVYEGQTLIGAGTITTAHALKTISFHLISNPATLGKLRRELAEIDPDPRSPIGFQRLRQLPYLSAVINEGLRLGVGVSSRLQRVAPDRALSYRDWTIPPGTPVSMSSLYMHKNSKVFPAPHEWRPERWLENNAMERLDKYLVPFSKGTRACLGANLAYAELYVAIATVFRQYNIKLYHTTREDVDVAHDFFNPSPRLDSLGLRVTVESGTASIAECEVPLKS